MAVKQADLTNEQIRNYPFLQEMYGYDFYPDHLVDKCKDILVDLCFQIEQNPPKNLDELYVLTNTATNKINDLDEEFYENYSQIETIAGDCIGTDFEFIAAAYGFKDADREKMTATRDW